MFVRSLICLALVASCAQKAKKHSGSTPQAADLCANTPLAKEHVPHSPYGHVVWNTLFTKTPNQSWTFYSKLFGWTKKRVNKDSEMIFANGVAFANFRQPQKGGTVAWGVSYGVENLEASLATIGQHGGKQFGKVIPLGKWGRVVAAQDPQGDFFSIQEVPAGQQTAPSGVILWNELHALDQAATVDFYRKVFTWETCTNKLPNGVDYTRFVRDGVRVAGFYAHKTVVDQDVAQRWLPHFQVTDIKAMVEKALKLKAKLLYPQSDVPEIGSFAAMQDPKGARFVLFQPAPEFK